MSARRVFASPEEEQAWRKIAGRMKEVRFAYGDSGAATKVPAFARQLGTCTNNNITDWEENGWAPKGGAAGLARIYEPLRARGVDPGSLASWVFKGVGDMPRPANLDDHGDPRPTEVAGELAHRTPRKGLKAAEVLSAQHHATMASKVLDAEIVRPMIEKALAGKSDMKTTLEYLYRLITETLVFAAVSTGAASHARTPSSASQVASCATPFIRKKKHVKAKKTSGGQRRRLTRTFAKKRMTPALTVGPSTTLTGMSQKRPFARATG